MKTDTRRSGKISGYFLINYINDLVLSLRCLCLCTRPSHATIRGIDPAQLKYLINSSLILLFGLLHTADGIVTYFGLKFNYATEVNPVLLFFAGTMGLGLAIFALKLLCVEFIALLYVTRRNIGSCWGTATLFSADAFYSWVVSNNIFLVLGV
ncbi:hypothetical protein A1359_10000 [Methylomonas lenta]|uniref:DUF5658 domain-containing protein n=1 Tax=Methylomonas lenta TaxID=980561 RepID=A0A177NBN4_9GAMM|nr:DUF5658 family protein [Methylomonas lenta]OAI15034.1 hypothetical protein A1359_10000 [Methylomonas lenta]